MRKHNSSHGSSLQFRDVQPGVRVLLGGAIAWTLAWKGVSLWRAARNGSKPWFATLLVSNTLGVLDAVYLFGVDRRHRSEHREELAVLAATGEPEQGAHRQET